MNLQEQYEEETNQNATESICGWECYTNDYVEWLEAKINHDLV